MAVINLPLSFSTDSSVASMLLHYAHKHNGGKTHTQLPMPTTLYTYRCVFICVPFYRRFVKYSTPLYKHEKKSISESAIQFLYMSSQTAPESIQNIVSAFQYTHGLHF